MKSLAFCLALVVVSQADLAAQDGEPEPATDVQRAEKTVRLARAEAAHYRIVRDDDPQAKIELHEKPILKWSNPTEGALFGSVMIWTVDGRPETVASIYRWYVDKHEFHAEFKSLSTYRLKTMRDDESVWDTGKSDIAFRELAHDAPPAENESRRAQQMRAIAKRFSADLVHPRKGRTELRLLTQPVYPYEKLPKDLLDGAMFAFVQGTDPEVLLLIEAEKTEGGARWKYAASRMNMFGLHLDLDGKQVWAAEPLPWAEVVDHRGPYSVFILEK